MNNNDRIRITFINNQILFNLEDAARLLGFKSLKSSLQILPDEVVYQLTIRNDTIFDVLKFINIKGLELLIRHSNYTFEYTDKDMIVKEITTETPPYSFWDGLVKVIPTTANIIIEFPECMINCNVKTEMVRLYSATEIAAEFGIRGKNLTCFSKSKVCNAKGTIAGTYLKNMKSVAISDISRITTQICIGQKKENFLLKNCWKKMDTKK